MNVRRWRSRALVARMVLGATTLGSAALGSAAVAGCTPPPCTPASCGDASTCVLGSCLPPARVPVGDEARRVVVTPRDVAAVAENLPGGGHATLPLGGRGPGDAAIYLAFALDGDLDELGEVEAAYVVAQPAAGAVTASAWIDVEARDVPDRFDGARVDWSRRPATGRPAAIGRTRGAEGTPLRIDVTELVRGWVRSGRRDVGVALVARAAADLGATVSTGLGAGAAPRLEVYLR